MSKPNYKHDCDECKFLGSVKTADFYVCPNSMISGSTLIARLSSEGPEYFSIPIKMFRDLIDQEKKVNPYLLKAYELYCNKNQT